MEITTEAASSSSNVVDELINNTRYGDFLKNLMQQVMRPEFKALKETVTGLCNEVHDLKQDNKELREDIEELKTDNEKLTGEMHELKVNNDKIKSGNTSLKLHIESIQMQVSRQNQNTEELMKYTRGNCLVIIGVSEKENENTDQLVKELMESKMEIELSDGDIDRTHRTGRSSDGKPRAIVVKLARYNTRNKIMRNRKMLKGTKMFINELLTPQTRGLLKRAKDLTFQAYWVKSAWTWDG